MKNGTENGKVVLNLINLIGGLIIILYLEVNWMVTFQFLATSPVVMHCLSSTQVMAQRWQSMKCPMHFHSHCLGSSYDSL